MNIIKTRYVHPDVSKTKLIKTTFYVYCNNLTQSLLMRFNVSVLSLGGLITISCHPYAQHGQVLGTSILTSTITRVVQLVT